MNKLLLLFLSVSLLRADLSPTGGVCSSHPCTIAVTCATSTCAATDIQTAINAAQLGDTITIQAGVAWTAKTALTLYRKTSGSGVLTIRTSTPDAQLPAPGVRITPAYKALLPELRATANNTVMSIEHSSNAVENYTFIGIWFSAAQGTDGYTLVSFWDGSGPVGYTVTGIGAGTPVTLTMPTTTGLTNGDHVLVQGGGCGSPCTPIAAAGWWTLANVTSTSVDLVGSVGDGRYYANTTITKLDHWDPSQTPNNIVFDRCLFLIPPMASMTRALSFGGRSLIVENSWCDQFKTQADSQCVNLPSTPGPVVITNNFLGGGAAEIILTGGVIPNLAGPDGTGQDTTDLTITHNFFWHDPALQKYEPWSASMWVRQGKIISANGTQYIAVASGTTGSTAPSWPSSRCLNPLAPTASCSVVDGGVTWERNWFSSQKWTFKNGMELKNGQRVAIKWNTFDTTWLDGQSGYAIGSSSMRQGPTGNPHLENIEMAYNVIRNTGFGINVASSGDYGDGITDTINIHDNLLMHPANYGVGGGKGMLSFQTRANGGQPWFSGLQVTHNTIDINPAITLFTDLISYPATGGLFSAPVWRDNLFNINGALYPFWGSGGNLRKQAFDNSSPNGYTFTNNVLAGENLAQWPSGNYNTAWSGIGFVNSAGSDYRLQNGSPYQGTGTDHKDIGADTTQLPQIRNLTATPTDRLALLTWTVTEPIQDIPCVAEVSEDRDFSTTIGDLDPIQFTRPETSENDRLPKNGLTRFMIVGANAALSSNASYWYRLHCGGALEQGSFTTLARLTGNTDFSISKSKLPTNPSNYVQVEWGTTYSRATDLISGGGTVQAACNAHGLCASTFQVPSGTVVYYRILEPNGDGQLASGPVLARAAGSQGY